MNITVFASEGNVFANCECINGCVFKKAAAWDNCALLPVICDSFALLRDNCAHFDRFECLLPHNSLA